MVAKRINVADLFCGAGGTSTGLGMAAARLGRAVNLTAVNHWDRAVETHAANHPKAFHFCQSLADLDPKKAVPGGKLDLLVASPECTHHSVARGGKPVNDQSRASAYCVHRWCAALDVKRVLIENVPEFQTWGPLDAKGRPTKAGRGKLFGAFIDTFKAMGYRVEWRVLNAADYGGATTRRRLFIQAAKGRLPIRWPERSHEPDPTAGLFASLPRWRAAREIIDWSLPGESIFTRKRPLSDNTLKRIEAGLRKFGGANAEPFLLLLNRTRNAPVGVGEPISTVTATSSDFALCEPFVLPPEGIHRGNAPRGVGQPMQTITAGRGGGQLVQPFIARMCNSGDDNCRVKSVEQPIGTIHAGGGSFGIVEPFVMHTTHHGSDRVYDPAEPLPCVTGANRGEQALVSPFIVPTNYGEREGQSPRCHDVDKPFPTVVAGGSTHGLVQPFIVPQMSSNGPRSVSSPIPTVTTTSRGVGLCEPFLVPFYANGLADAVADPLRTVTTKDRHALVEPDRCRLDIRFRMLQPHELAAAMGFPKDYKITGNRSEQVKQVGNAVEVNQAKALILAMLEDVA
ncbi:DNA cytosine methyltransferase [Gemmata sp.]|uniref:DNA cytosine methyltransferase n=1 Tax=Gemmata sp. TaxID=1914242 RepID=UPI003F7217C9